MMSPADIVPVIPLASGSTNGILLVQVNTLSSIFYRSSISTSELVCLGVVSTDLLTSLQGGEYSMSNKWVCMVPLNHV